MRSALVLIAALVSGGCQEEISIAPSALVGCRSPGEQGCERCCEVINGETVERSFSGQLPDTPYIEPWYNVASRELMTPSCPTCARCTIREETTLRELGTPICDCSEPVGLDPCFASGCPCECSMYNALRESCPK